MRAAFVRVDVVGERELLRVVAVVPLHRDFDVDAVAVAVHEHRLLVDDALVLVQVLDERDDAAVVVEAMALAGFALVVERDGDAGVEERELAQAAGERVEAEVDDLEDLRVGLERDLRAAALGRAGDGEIGERLAALVALLVRLARCARSRDRAARTARSPPTRRRRAGRPRPCRRCCRTCRRRAAPSARLRPPTCRSRACRSECRGRCR